MKGNFTVNNKIYNNLGVDTSYVVQIKPENLLGTVDNKGTIYLFDGTLSQTLNGKVIIGGTVITDFSKLTGTFSNNGTLKLNGDLTKNIAGTGTTILQSTNVNITNGVTLEGVLDMNGRTLNMANGTAGENLTVGSLMGTGTLKLDVDLTGNLIDKFTISNGISNGTNATLNLSLLNLWETEKTQDFQFIYGDNANVEFTLDKNRYESTGYKYEASINGNTLRIVSSVLNPEEIIITKIPNQYTLGAETVTADNFEINGDINIVWDNEENIGKFQATRNIEVKEKTRLEIIVNKRSVVDYPHLLFLADNELSVDPAVRQNSVGRVSYTISSDGILHITNVKTATEMAISSGASKEQSIEAEAWDDMPMHQFTTAGKIATALAKLSNKGGSAYVRALDVLAPKNNMAILSQTESMNDIANISMDQAGAVGKSGGFENLKGNVWAKGLRNHAKIHHSDGFKADNTGFATGVDVDVSDKLKIGLGYGYTDTDISAEKRTASVETHTGFVYGQYNFDSFYVASMVGISRGHYSELKHVQSIPVSSKYKVMSMGVYLSTGIPMGMFTPELGIRFNRSVQHEYVDTAYQIVDQKTTTKGTSVAGVKFGKETRLTNELSIKPTAKIFATYDFKRDKGTNLVTLPNGAKYQSESKTMDRFGVEIGTGLSLIHKGNVEISLDYIGKFKNDYTDHTGMITVRYDF